MTTEAGNKVKFELANARIDFLTDSFQIILMNSTFIFDKDTHHGYADVSASELANGNGYTTLGITMTGVTVFEDDVNDFTEVEWNNVTWTAAGGDMGPTVGAIIYDDTATAPQADTIIGFIDFGGVQTQIDGGTATIANPKVRIT